MIAFAKLIDTGSALNSDAYRAAIRTLASGVSIITAGQDNEWAGMTVTSLTSLSIDPPAVLVSINRTSSIVPFLERYGHFAANILAADHEELANRFAGRGGIQGASRFLDGEWTASISGAPVLKGALAALECKFEEIIPRHSHFIVIGRVLRAETRENADALLHWQGDYARIQATSAHTG